MKRYLLLSFIFSLFLSLAYAGDSRRIKVGGTTTLSPNITGTLSGVVTWYWDDGILERVAPHPSPYRSLTFRALEPCTRGTTITAYWDTFDYSGQVYPTTHEDSWTIYIEEVQPTNVSLGNNSKKTIELPYDDTYNLTASVMPSYATTTLLWESSNSSVTVTKTSAYKASVTGSQAGATARITVTTDNGKSDYCDIKVLSKDLTSLYISSKSILKGDYAMIDVTRYPSFADDGLSWESSNTNIVTVDQNGRVYGKNVGTATITATSKKNSSIKASCTVTVYPCPTSISLNYNSIDIEGNGSQQLKATVYPLEASQSVNWEVISGEDVVTVTSSGFVMARTAGTAKIRATSTIKESVYNECSVTVTNSLALNCTKANLDVGDNLQLSARITPIRTSQEVIWSSGNTNVATVSASGLVTAKAPGTVYITVTSVADNTLYKTCKLIISKSTEVKVGADATSSDYEVPYANNNKYATTQMIYTPAEIGIHGKITSLSFKVAEASPLTTNELKVYLGHKSGLFSSANNYVKSSDLTLVYSGTPTLGNAGGWETLTFNQNYFVYNGEDNLVVVITRKSDSGIYNLKYNSFSGSGYMLYRSSSNTGSYADVTNTSNAYQITENRPSIKFQFSEEICIGDDATSSSGVAPYENYGNYSTLQTLYTPEEIGRKGKITSIAFRVAKADSYSTSEVKIYLGHTSEHFSISSYYLRSSDLTLVYSGSPTLGQTVGWETLKFNQEEFVYNGIDNLVVVVTKKSDGENRNLEYYYLEGYGYTLLRWSDDVPDYADVTNTSYNYFTTTERPCIKIDIAKSQPSDMVDIGEDATVSSNEVPYGNDYQYSAMQTIYTPVEIGRSGNINSIAFKVSTANTFDTSSVMVYLGHRSGTFNDKNDYSTSDDLTLVYYGSPTLGQAAGWETLEFNQGTFMYNGTDNLVVVVTRSSSSSKYNLNYSCHKKLDYFNWYNYYTLTRKSNITGSIVEIDDPTAYSFSENHYRPSVRIGFGEPKPMADGETFDIIIEGKYAMTFKVISAEGKTCQVGNGEDSAINSWQSGTITIPDKVLGYTVTRIGDKAFFWSRYLTNVNIPNSVTSIGNQAFDNCVSLTDIFIPKSVTTIGEGAFSECTGLTDIEIPESVTSIGYGAFSSCTALTNIVIPESVTFIGEMAFIRCSGLKNIVIPNSVNSIKKNTFDGCTSLTDVVIPNSVISIGQYAFSNCSELKQIIIPNSVKSIENYVFYGCTSLISVVSEMKEPLYFVETKAFDKTYNATNETYNATLFVPYGTKSKYETADIWNRFANIVEMAPKEGDLFTEQIKDNQYMTFCITNAEDMTCQVESIRADAQTITIDPIASTSSNYLPYGCFYKYSTSQMIYTPTDVGRSGKINSIAFMVADAYSQPTTEVKIYMGHKSGTFSGTGDCVASKNLTLVYSGKPRIGQTAGWETYVLNQNSFIYNGTDNLVIVVTKKSSSYNSNTRYSCFEKDDKNTYTLRRQNLNTSNYADITNTSNYKTDTYRPCIQFVIGTPVNIDGDVEIPKVAKGFSVTGIGNDAFSNRKDLTSVTIPHSITAIGNNAFKDCTNLISVKVNIQQPMTISETTFENYTNAVLYVPYGSKDKYETMSNWNQFTNIVEMEPVSIENITLPESTQMIIGETQELTPVIIPEDATDGMTWSSENEEVATVDENGVVTAVGKGTTYIYCVSDDAEHIALCQVNVYEQGDVNGNGEVNEVDAQQILDVSVGLLKIDDLIVPKAVNVPGGNDKALEVNAQKVLDYSVAKVKPW